MRGQLARYGNSISTRKAGRREGRAAIRGPTGAVAPRGHRENGRRQRRRPLQNTIGSGGGDRCIKRGAAKRAAVTGSGRPLQAAVTESGRPLQAAVTESGRPLQAAVTEKGGGYFGGRYRKRAAVTGGRYRKQCPEAGCLNTPARDEKGLGVAHLALLLEVKQWI